MIRFINIRHFAGDRELFTGLTWHVKPGERVALVGDNGSGKTTLLRMAVRETEPVEGEVITRRNARIGYLRQEVHSTSGGSVLHEAMCAFEEEQSAAAELQELYPRLSDAADDEQRELSDRIHALEKRIIHHDEGAARADACKVLVGLGFKLDELDRPLSEFSGGWQMRAQIARLLLEQPDLLMLDEPTNHLDLESIAWLEQFLTNFPGALIIVSHDRYFLDRITNRTAWITQRRVRVFTGGYSEFVKQREQEEELLVKRYANQQEEIARVQQFIDRFRYKASKAAAVQSRVKMLDKVERVELPSSSRRVRLRIPEPQQGGRQMLELKDVSKSYEEKSVLRNVNLVVEQGDKIALVGPNGAGKSTLLKICAGVLEHQGLRVPHPKAILEYFSQHRVDTLNPDNTALEEARPPGAHQTDDELRSLLGCFLFSGDDVYKPVRVLSGGEKSRLALARMLLRRGNLLLLDEPTNHLDIATREILQDALREFPGTIVMISHDRWFLDAIINRVIEVGGGNIRTFIGNYSDYLWKKQADEAAAAAAAEANKSESTPDRGRRSSSGDRRERTERRTAVKTALDRVQADIERMETRLSAIHELQSDPDAYATGKITAEIAAEGRTLELEIARLMPEWEKLVDEYERVRSAN